jgi:glyoxylase-like metal-dependent hydrolase (beta-lactamase superfamily II)
VSTLEEIADGIYRLGTDWVNWYLCDADGTLTLIDCGFRDYYGQLPAALLQLGRSLDAVAAVVLTHYHSDHVGCAERIRTEAGAAVRAPADDAKGVRTGQVPLPGGLAPSLWRPVMMRYLAHAVRNGGATVTPVTEIQTYDDGELLDVPVRLRAIHTPGHTAGHCALLAEDHGVLFAGDAFANVNFFTREQSPQTLPFNEDAARAKHSLCRLEAVSARIVAVGHGAPFPGTPAEAVSRARAKP